MTWEAEQQRRREARNPALALPGVRALRQLDQPTRDAIAAALRSIRADALTRAEYSWRKHKAPMAAYWKAVGVYAGHLARAIGTPL